MRVKLALKREFILLFFFSLFFKAASAQGTSQSLTPELIQKSVSKAIKEEEKRKAQEEQELESALKTKNDQAVKNWISQRKEQQAARLNTYTHEDWDNFLRIDYPVPYDFYLRGYDCRLAKASCFKSGSFDLPYQGSAEIIEKFYIENYHPSNVVDKSAYFQTVIRPIKLKLVYQANDFRVTAVEYGQVYTKYGWQKDE
ncbi:MAG: hypothetical protein PHN59_01180 [Candidatus Omnitrophica bacterium]|nr:hypothetical protein [Candidatus Omnitrophota bacterium]